MSEHREIRTTSDIAALTAEEFERFIPDLILWHHYMRQVVDVHGDAAHEGCAILWKDDGKIDLTHVHLIDRATGKTMILNIDGSAA